MQRWRHGWRLLILAFVGLFVCVTIATAQDNAPPETVVDRFPVELNGEVLFEIEKSVGAFSAQERAKAITQRLQEIAADQSIAPDALAVEENNDSISIVVEDQILLTISPGDAQVAGRSSPVLALQYRDQLRAAITEYRTDRTSQSLLYSGIYAVLTTLVAGLIFYLMGRIFPWFYRQINLSREKRIPSLRIQQMELVSAARIADLLIGTAKLTRTITTIVLLYLYLTLVLSFFHWTRRAGAIMLDYVIANLQQMWAAFISYLPNFFTIFTVLVAAYYVIRLLQFLFKELERETISFPGFHPDWSTPTFRLLLVLVIGLAAVISFPYLPGFSSPAFQGVSLFLGVLFSLGSTAVVANIVAGIILIYTRSFQESDRVQIADVTGEILEKNLLVTRILTPKNVAVTIPNAAVLGSNIINYSAANRDHRIPPLVVHTTVTLGYDVPWRTVEEVLVNAAIATPDILPEPLPFVLQTSLDDFYVSYELNAHTKAPGRLPQIYSHLHKNIQDGCNAADIEILSPHYSAVRDGHHTTIPANYLPNDYQAPHFRVQSIQQSDRS